METEHLILTAREAKDAFGKMSILPETFGFTIKTNYKNAEQQEVVANIIPRSDSDEITIICVLQSFLRNICDYDRFTEYVKLVDEAEYRLKMNKLNKFLD